MGGNRSASASETSNVDNRFAVQDGIGLSDSSIGGNVTFNSTQAITDISAMATNTINRASNNVAELTGYAIDRNLDSLDNTINRSTALTDSIIKQSYEASQAAIATANNQAAAAIASANDTAAYAIRGANDQTAKANAAATKVTTDTLEGSRALIGDQQAAINKLAADNTKLGFGLADVAIKAWTPTDNKALDTIKTVGMVAAAAVAAAFIFRSKGKA